MRTLITNDDGVDSPGIEVLARPVAECALDVVVAAPEWDASGASASLTAVQRDGQLCLDQRALPHLPDVVVCAVEAAPAFIVRVAPAQDPAVISLNVPNLRVADVRGFERVRLAAFGAVQTNITESGEGYVKLAYEEVAADFEPKTDAAALRDGGACFTPLIGVCEGSFDVPDGGP